MSTATIESQVKVQIEAMQQQGLQAVAVMLGHEDWLVFQLNQLLLIRHLAVRVVTSLH